MTEIESLNLKLLLEHAHIGVVIHRADTSIVYANPTALRLLRLTYEQIIGRDAFDAGWNFIDQYGRTLPPEDYPVSKVQAGQRLVNEVLGVVDSQHTDVSWFLINGYAEGFAESAERFIVITFNDITDTKHLFSFQDIVESTQDIVIVTEAADITNPTGPKIVYVNQAFEQLTGYSREEAVGETPRMLQGALTDKQATARIHKALLEQVAISEQVLNYDKNGRPYWIEMNIIPLSDREGKVTHFAAIERDVSEKKFHLEQLEKRNADLKLFKENLEKIVSERTQQLEQANNKLQQLAFFDPLTGLPNRRYFLNQSKKLIASCNRANHMMAFGLIDIDHFKRINDAYGHDIGDQVLIELGKLFSHFFRLDDAFCRYGGEEFAFAVSVKGKENVIKLVERLIEAIRALEIEIGQDQPLKITASIGVKFSPAHEMMDIEAKLKQADKGLYFVKENGRDGYDIV